MLDAFCREYAELDRRNKAPPEIEIKVDPSWTEDPLMCLFADVEPTDPRKMDNLRDVRKERIIVL